MRFLVKALVTRASTITQSSSPGYVRHSYNLSHIITLSVIGSWGLAAWVSLATGDLQLAITLLLSPLVVALLLSSYANRWMGSHRGILPYHVRELRAEAVGLDELYRSGIIGKPELKKRKADLMKRVKSQGLS